MVSVIYGFYNGLIRTYDRVYSAVGLNDWKRQLPLVVYSAVMVALAILTNTFMFTAICSFLYCIIGTLVARFDKNTYKAPFLLTFMVVAWGILATYAIIQCFVLSDSLIAATVITIGSLFVYHASFATVLSLGVKDGKAIAS